MNLDYWIRRLLGKATCRLQAGARLARSARIRNARGSSYSIRIGANSYVAGELLTFAHGGEIHIGEWCFIGEGARLWSACKITLGNRVLVSHNVNIFDSHTHPIEARARHLHIRAILRVGHPKKAALAERPVRIGDDVWIGANTCILRGVRIGKGAVIGASSVVTRDIAPGSVVAGNPIRLLRRLSI